jgi:hypothetical protein
MVANVDSVTRTLLQGDSVYKDSRALHISSTHFLYLEFYVDMVTWSLAT